MSTEQTIWVRAAYAVTNKDTDRMIALLEEHGIPARRQGGSRDIYTLKLMYGEEIMVQAEDLERAQELLRQAAAKNSGKKDDPEAQNSQERGSDGGEKFPLRAVISWLIVAILLAAVLWPVIQSRM